ncbi:ParB/RepB/Spo0J family partition protein [Pseudoxanthomonas mexicana]
MTQIQSIPLSLLRLSSKNSRKHRSKDSIAALAESLRVNGQLQNLVVSGPAADGTYDVDAGGTRFLAFGVRANAGEIPADYPVDCKVIAPEGAREASLAENTLREPMHPADQFRAFRALVDDGKSAEEVAAHFSIAPSVVLGRLKLANVAPDLFEIYEKGDMVLDQLQALALTDDHAAQRSAWFGVKGAKIEHDWQRRAPEIRKRITSKEVGPDNKLVGFVGADAYEAAGGAVRRDMFSDAVYFSDEKLLEKLAAAKLGDIAEKERAKGWSWVETHLAMDYSARSRYGYGFSSSRGNFTAAEKTRLAEIAARIEAIEEAEVDDDVSDEAYDAMAIERGRIEEERDALYASSEKWSKEALEKSGVLIYIDQHSGLQIERGRLKPGQRITEDKKVTGGKDSTPKKPELSADMVERLNMHRTASIRHAVASSPAAALQLLLCHLAARLMTKTSADSLMEINPSNAHLSARGLIDSKYKDVGTAGGRIALDKMIAGWSEAGLPSKASELPSWVDKLTQEKQIELLAVLVAMTIPTLNGARGTAVADQFGVDMRAWWTATPERFTSIVPKAMLALAVGEVDGKPAAEKVLLQNKAGATAEATRILEKSGWLPKPLRGQAYAKAEPLAAAAPAGTVAKAGKPAVPKASPAKKPAAKKAAVKKVPAKKPAKKAAPKKAAKAGKK